MEKLVAAYKFDMEQLNKEELGKLKGKLKRPDVNDIDPATGKPRVGQKQNEDDDHFDFSEVVDFDQDVQDFQDKNTEFNHEKFKEWFKKR